MEIYTYSEYTGLKNQEDCKKEADFFGTSLCLGYFDGVHLAHRAIFEKAREYGKWGVLLPDRNMKGMPLLTTRCEKIKLIAELGADYVLITEFSEDFMSRTPDEFADFLKDTLKVSRVVAGYDYRFGKNADGDAKMLKALAKTRGFLAEIVDAKCIKGEPIKSTKIREYISRGDVFFANELLGYSYFVSGRVEKGLGNGRKLGFPTANIAYDGEKLLPADGVYYGQVFGKNAVINVGKNPTFNGERRTVEAHILDFDADLYGEVIEVSFLKKIRDDIKFENQEALIAQINKDIEFVKGR